MHDMLVKKLLSLADGLNLPSKVLAPVAALVAREKKLQDAIVAARAAGDSAFAAAVNDLAASGEISGNVTRKLAFYDAVVPRGDRPAPLERAVEHARMAVMRDAVAAGQQRGPMVFEALKAIADTAAERAAATKIPAGVVDDKTAFMAKVTTERWEELHAAWQFWEDAHSAYELLRKLGWVPEPSVPTGPLKTDTVRVHAASEKWLRYGNPLRCPEKPAIEVRKAMQQEWPALFLAHSATAGARPGMYSPQDAMDAFTRYVHAQIDARRHGPTVTGRDDDLAQQGWITQAVDGLVSGRPTRW